MLKEYREAEQKHVGYVQLRDSEVLRALVFLVRMAHGRTSGRPKSRAFVDFLLAQFPEKPGGIAAPEDAGSIGSFLRVVSRRTSDGQDESLFREISEPALMTTEDLTIRDWL